MIGIFLLGLLEKIAYLECKENFGLDWLFCMESFTLFGEQST